MSLVQISSLRPTGQEFEEVRGGHLFRFAQPEIWYRRVARRAQESLPGFFIQEQLYPDPEKAEGVLLVQRSPRPAFPRRTRTGSEKGEDGPRSHHHGSQRARLVIRI